MQLLTHELGRRRVRVAVATRLAGALVVVVVDDVVTSSSGSRRASLRLARLTSASRAATSAREPTAATDCAPVLP